MRRGRKLRSDKVSHPRALSFRLRLFGGRVLGPDKPAVARVKALCIRKIVLKLELGIDLAKARRYLRMARKQTNDDARYKSVTIYFDVDPM